MTAHWKLQGKRNTEERSRPVVQAYNHSYWEAEAEGLQVQDQLKQLRQCCKVECRGGWGKKWRREKEGEKRGGGGKGTEEEGRDVLMFLCLYLTFATSQSVNAQTPTVQSASPAAVQAAPSCSGLAG